MHKTMNQNKYKSPSLRLSQGRLQKSACFIKNIHVYPQTMEISSKTLNICEWQSLWHISNYREAELLKIGYYIINLQKEFSFVYHYFGMYINLSSIVLSLRIPASTPTQLLLNKVCLKISILGSHFKISRVGSSIHLAMPLPLPLLQIKHGSLSNFPETPRETLEDH